MSDPPAPIRRSATLPTRLMSQRRESSGSPTSTAQGSDPVLYFNPSAKIVKFAPDAPRVASQSAPSIDFDYPVDTIETLPWRSPTERTVAVGRLRLELVSGLTPFLKCGTVVQAILKNSQCWCVDRSSTFVLRIRSLTYYRIELPNQTPEEVRLVEEFKNALPKVLRYEVTPCPFERGFSVPLPVEARTPKKKKAWRPKDRRDSAPVILGVKNNGWLEANNAADTQRPRSAGTSDGEATDDSASTTTNSALQAEASGEEVQEPASSYLSDETPGFIKRSVTEPQSVHNILARFQPIPESDSEDDDRLSSSADSFHSFLPSSFESSASPSFTSQPESPLDTSFQDLSIARQRPHGHNRDISDVTITAGVLSSAAQTTPRLHQLVLDEQENVKSSANSIPSSATRSQHSFSKTSAFATGTESVFINSTSDERSTLKSRSPRSSTQRALSPMPPPSTLAQTSEYSETDITTSLFHKTCALVLVPPLQLLLLLIHIAARIAAGHTVQTALLDTTHGADEDDDDFEMPKTPGNFRQSIIFDDPSDSLSDL
ncbi:inheritance of peroxisomes protein 1-domain-containing protein, partial [Talaromyces proteolyticus]